MCDLEVQDFSDPDDTDANVDEEVIYPSVKPEVIRMDSELFKSTLPIRVDSSKVIPEVSKWMLIFFTSHLLHYNFYI